MSGDQRRMARQPGRLKLCLAASGGGHLRQLLDLKSVWSAHDYVFVTDVVEGQEIGVLHGT